MEKIGTLYAGKDKYQFVNDCGNNIFVSDIRKLDGNIIIFLGINPENIFMNDNLPVGLPYDIALSWQYNTTNNIIVLVVVLVLFIILIITLFVVYRKCYCFSCCNQNILYLKQIDV